MKVTELIIYPIKSLKGIKVPKTTVLEKGFKYDRRWMLVDEHGIFITQRKHSILHKFKLELHDTYLHASYKGNEGINIPLKIDSDEKLPVQVWKSKLVGTVASKAINDWFSDAISMKCKLAFMPENTIRLADQFGDTTVSLADQYPYLILGTASMNDLNDRMERPLPIHRFRPNIIFEGGQPYEEDKWANFKISNIEFKGIAPCVRCVFTTIDQETGTSGKEPLKTLVTYRKQGKGVIFGAHAISRNEGTLNVGDEIFVMDKKD